ncbi:hypothetical protein N9Z65_00725 [bacterium]|nr:hypothetical protein [bacterium]
MKITLNPTEAVNEEHPNCSMHSTISIAHPKDDHTIDDAIELLVIPALMAWGFTELDIDKALAHYK